MKKLFAVLLALTLVLSMGTVAFAANTGSITINNALAGSSYNIYKMFSFEPTASDANKGRYYVEEAWKGFMTDNQYLEYDNAAGTIKLKDGVTESDYPALAKAAVAYAIENNIQATATKKAETDGSVTFENMAYGYYAIDTTLGTVCALTNVNNSFEAHEKNSKPEIEKLVKEDSDNSWGTVNDADIGDKVEFKATITVGDGGINYVMHDTMGEGLTFNDDVVVTVSETTVAAANYTVTKTCDDGCTFEVEFKDEYIATLAKDTKVVVTYSATLNANAVIATEGNPNKVTLKYGDNSEFTTTEKTTKTFTWKMDVLKFTNVETTKAPLADATFQLLDSADTAIKFTKVENATVPTYKVDKNGTVTDITTEGGGKFEIIGLDEGTYNLKETKAPAGYNNLKTTVEVKITSEHNDTELTASYKINGNAPATIEVENKTGVLLPETGGMGTTIFYIVGSALMLAAFILLVVKKRMASFA